MYLKLWDQSFVSVLFTRGDVTRNLTNLLYCLHVLTSHANVKQYNELVACLYIITVELHHVLRNDCVP